MTDTPELINQLSQAAQGSPNALGPILAGFEARLVRIVKLRLDQRLRSRIDPADIVQETFLKVSQRLEDYLRDPAVPFFIWVRYLALQELSLAHRKHLGVQARDVRKEFSLYGQAAPQASSAALAAQLVGKLTSPSQAAIKAETKFRIQEALTSMDEMDREILALRHFEQMSNSETAQSLGINESTACNRYVRALERLKRIHADRSGEAKQP